MGPCAKQVVTATIIAPNGRRFVGRNECCNPQKRCPRELQGMKTGDGYELCWNICKQPWHAEFAACRDAWYSSSEIRGSVLYLEGHEYVCDECREACERIGVDKIVIGAPPR